MTWSSVREKGVDRLQDGNSGFETRGRRVRLRK